MFLGCLSQLDRQGLVDRNSRGDIFSSSPAAADLGLHWGVGKP